MPGGARQKRVVWTSIGGVAGLLVLWLALRGHEEPPYAFSRGRAPDVVFISVDTLRRDHLSVYGYHRPTDPNLARLAEEALVFDNAVAAHTNTGPSHASMMTGLYPPSHGVLRNRYRLKPDAVTLAQRLRGLGYQTVGVVSSVMLSDRLTGLGKGFDVYLACAPGVSDRQAPSTWQVVERRLSLVNPSRPLFLFVHFFDPHYPYRPPEAYARPFLPAGNTTFRFPENAALGRLRAGGARPGELEEYIARYDGEIRLADTYVGKLLARLRALGRYQHAVVVVVSDHGETLDERPVVFDHGARVYEEQIRIPLLLRLPGGRCGGLRTSLPVHHVDLVPTVFEILGLPLPTGLEGHPVVRSKRTGSSPEGQPCAPPPWVAPEADPPPLQRALVTFARPDAQRVPHLPVAVVDRGLVASLRLWPWKLISYPTADGRYDELFMLTEDPHEHRNRAADHPERAQAMAKALTPWVVRVEETPGTGPLPLSDQEADLLRALGYAR